MDDYKFFVLYPLSAPVNKPSLINLWEKNKSIKTGTTTNKPANSASGFLTGICDAKLEFKAPLLINKACKPTGRLYNRSSLKKINAKK